MIRYVLAIVLTVAVLSIGMAGIDHAAAVRSEQQVDTQIAAIEAAAVSLVANDDVPPPGHPGPRRVVELDLPRDGRLSSAVDSLVVEPDRRLQNESVEVGDGSRALYQFDGRAKRVVSLDVRIRDALRDGTTETTVVDLSGETGQKTLVLELRSDRYGPFVAVRSPPKR